MPESIDWAFIAEQEGAGVTTGYVPNPTGSDSGVTIATGFDLGQRNESDLTNLGLSAALITKFRPYLGLRRQAAVTFLAQNPLTITQDEANEIDRLVRAQKVPILKERYRTAPGNTAGILFDDLPSQAQTVIASVSFQYGNLATRTPMFWAAVTAQNWVEAVRILRNFGDSYPSRRRREADLLDQVNRAAAMIADILARIRAWHWLLLVIFFGVSCSTTFTQTKVIIFDEDLAEAYQNFDRSAAKKRREIKFESGAAAANCNDYWRELEKSTVKEDVANQLFKADYVQCDALKILGKQGKTTAVSTNEKAAANYANEIYDRLDLTSFPSSLAPTLDNANRTFAAGEKKFRARVEPAAVVSQTDDWNFVVQIVAETDANRDGKKDLIVYVVDESKEGNFRSYSTLLIYSVDAKGDLKAVAAK